MPLRLRQKAALRGGYENGRTTSPSLSVALWRAPPGPRRACRQSSSWLWAAVIRSAESTCLLLYQAPLSETGERRLKTIRDSEDGFRIAEEDLSMRGAGDLIGTAQSGLPRFRVADLERQAGLMAVAQSDARALLQIDPGLTGPRGAAARVLLWLLDQDRAIRLIGVG